MVPSSPVTGGTYAPVTKDYGHDPMTPTPASPRLTRLELHGFKSFANRTVLQFEPGITAIIGPNGSGKSNISDAVRWVLGETSHATLRSKKTEDVIFAGGQGRAPAGMAEVSVTFDNSTGWLPIAFSEVTVTRRAFRTGETQYLINNRRVRLKDILHLTASLGQSYTVVGQGLIDAALSQRAEERRGLFEHAADLTGLRLKAAEAERSLAEAEANAARLTDLLTELEPRLRSLERAARQAREWKELHERLRALQRVHFARLLSEAMAKLAELEAAASGDAERVAACQAEANRLATALAEARAAADRARGALSEHDTHLQSLIENVRRLEHARDLTEERHAALTRRRQDMADTEAGLHDQVAAVERDLATVRAEIAATEQEVEAARTSVTILQAEGAAARQSRRQAEQQAAQVAAAIAEGERRLTELTRRRALLEQRQQTDQAERERIAAGATERQSRIDRLTAELAAFDEAEAKASEELKALEQRLAEIAAAIERATADERAARNGVAAVERQISEASARLEALRRIQESGAGLYAGVRATLQAARAGKLSGIRGTIAELLDVPAEYDTAIEVALGGHLQDIVVERWSDAEAAIAFLKRNNAGRATFQPLDTVRAPRIQDPRDALAVRGVHGIASTLVRYDDSLSAVVAALLGRTLVVEDLPAARASLPHLPPGWSAVTLGGEIARTGGSVTGGSAIRESGVLSRERELRTLPRTIARLERDREAAIAKLQAVTETLRQLGGDRRRIEDERAGHLATRKERQGQRARIATWLNELQAEAQSEAKHLNALTTAAASIAADLEALDREIAVLTTDLDERRKAHAEMVSGLQREADAVAERERALAEEQRRLATLDERLRGQRRREASLLAQRDNIQEELAVREERAAALDREVVAVAEEREQLAREAAEAAAARDAARTERAALEAKVKEAESDVARAERALEAARNALLEAERAHSGSSLAVERTRGDLAALRQRISDELELAEPDSLLAGDGPLPEATSDDPEREITRLKERLRRVGYVGEDAVADYEREAERHAFLRAQLDDVQGAVASLRRLLDELHDTMKRRFDETFAKVAAAFTDAFTTLFGGGTARLILVPGADGTGAGIDIVAQPPGKRLQSLALLSGGERALTAAALLFAILTVNPTPFCLLDEVDAALDEANIVRFRERLQALAAETQVIIITHNRGTIEVADTLYGVSMREDGVSQVLSLRLTEAAAG